MTYFQEHSEKSVGVLVIFFFFKYSKIVKTTMKLTLTLLPPELKLWLWMSYPTHQESTGWHDLSPHRCWHVWCGFRGVQAVCYVHPYGHTNFVAVHHLDCKEMFLNLYFTVYSSGMTLWLRNPWVSIGVLFLCQSCQGVLLLCWGTPCRRIRGKDLGLFLYGWN